MVVVSGVSDSDSGALPIGPLARERGNSREPPDAPECRPGGYRVVLHKFAIPPIQVRGALAPVEEVIPCPANVRQ